jgi:hypothetical protein
MVRALLLSSVLGFGVILSFQVLEERVQLEAAQNSLKPLRLMKQVLIDDIAEDQLYLHQLKIRDTRTMLYLAHDRGYHRKDELNWRVISRRNNWLYIWK